MQYNSGAGIIYLHSLIEPQSKADRRSSSRPTEMFPCTRYRRTHAFHTNSSLRPRLVIATWAFLVVQELPTIPDIDRNAMHFSFAFRAEIHYAPAFNLL